LFGQSSVCCRELKPLCSPVEFDCDNDVVPDSDDFPAALP